MLPRLVDAKYLHDYVVWVRFADGAEGEVDLRHELKGDVFEPLRDRALFAQARFSPDVRTVVWPNGADFAPEFLRAALRVAA
jgi:hypothetical protein